MNMIGIPEEVDGKNRKEEIFEKIMAKNFSE